MRFLWKLLVFLALAGVLLAGAPPAGADCTQSGVIYLTSYVLSSKIASFQLVSGAYPTVRYRYTINNSTGEAAGVIDLLTVAAAGGLRVQITGNATACPTTGLSRNGGLIKSVKVFSLY